MGAVYGRGGMPGGRPKIEITPEMCDKAEALAAQGLNREQIASVLGFAAGTLYEKQKEYPEFYEAIKRGADKGIATIANSLFQSAKGGNITAQIFYLKNRAPSDWKDRRDHTHTGSDGGAIEHKVEGFRFWDAESAIQARTRDPLVEGDD